ncbi:ribokinase [Clostridium polynesiense]|uniref:ribokinase n=1 Tax=Clostridium polynesiense TaxID=1325933 RepID=UPI00059131E3|nr:ribokinase [Clostridium polynesiense]
MKKVIVVGSLNMDLTIKVDKMPNNGETIQGNAFFMNEGGKGGNQAVAAVRSGAQVSFVGSVGKDAFGEKILSSLRENNINTDAVQIQDKDSTGLAMIIRHNNDNRIILNPGANETLTFSFAKDKLDEIASEEDIFITQFENDIEVTLKLIEHAKNIGMTTILNPAPAKKFSEDFYKYIDILVINQSECEILTGIYPESIEECKKAGRELRGKGIKNAVITLGSQGSVTITPEEIIEAEAYKVSAVDSTAAGDSFIGAMAAKLSFGETFNEALKYATKVSAITVTREGAQVSIPTSGQVEEIFKNKGE